MVLNNELNIMLDELVKLELNKGITPTELASNIYSDGYTEVNIKKQLGILSCSVIFYDSEFFNELQIKQEYTYLYNKEFILQEILHKKNKNVELIWSRRLERTKLVQGIIQKLNEHGGKAAIGKFLESLPKDLIQLANELNLQIS
jgi:hypothetical protein